MDIQSLPGEYYDALARAEAMHVILGNLTREDREAARLALACTLFTMAYREQPVVVMEVLLRLQDRLSEEQPT